MPLEPGIDWKTSSLARGSAGRPQVPRWDKDGWGPSPGVVSRQMLLWSSTSDPLSPTPFFLLFLFPSFPPHRASILETNFKIFFFF